MDDYKSSKNYRIKEINIKKKNKINYPNVFSNISNIEKNKQFINLQKNLKTLSNDVVLLMNSVKNIYGRKKNDSSNKGLGFNKFISRNNQSLKTRRIKKFNSLINMINNHIESNKNKMEESIKKINKLKGNKTKTLDVSKEQNLRNKRKINKTVNNLIEIPKINFNILNTKLTKQNEIKINDINISDRTPKLHNLKNIKIIIENNIKSVSDKNKEIVNNLTERKLPNIINSKSTKNCINRFELIKKVHNEEKLIKDKNSKIKDRINYKLAEQNLIDWSMKSKLKFARWKFDIPEVEKYFYNLNVFDQPENQELIKRKTFYDHLEELIDEIQNTEEKKDTKKIKDKKYKNEEKEIEENNEDLNMVDNALNKHFEISKVLNNIKKRRLDEERKRYIIGNILINSDLRRKSINRSTGKLYFYKNNNKKEDFIKPNENKIEEKNFDEHSEINFT